MGSMGTYMYYVHVFYMVYLYDIVNVEVHNLGLSRISGEKACNVHRQRNPIMLPKWISRLATKDVVMTCQLILFKI